MRKEPSGATVSLSPLDSARWKVTTAKAFGVTADNLAGALAYCRQHGVAFLIARCPATDLSAAQAMEREGFQLMDTLIYYSRSLIRAASADSAALEVRELRSGEEAEVRRVASLSFAGYAGHYHADGRLDRAQCDELYADWAQRSCVSRGVADAVLVSTLEGRIIAFATLSLNDPKEGEGVLFGVAPQAQGRGAYRSLMIGAMRWCRTQGAARMVVSTQVTNIVVQKIWTRLGFEPSKSYYTFHKWF